MNGSRAQYSVLRVTQQTVRAREESLPEESAAQGQVLTLLRKPTFIPHNLPMYYRSAPDIPASAPAAAANAHPTHALITSVLLVLVVLPDRPAAA